MRKFTMDAKIKEVYLQEIIRSMRLLYFYTKYPGTCQRKLSETTKISIKKELQEGILEGWYDHNIELPCGGIAAFGPKKRPIEEVATITETNKENNKIRLRINNSKEDLDIFANNLKKNFIEYFEASKPLQITQSHS